jgi:hypothetical protein
LRCRIGTLTPVQVWLTKIRIDVRFEVCKGLCDPHSPKGEHFFDMDEIQAAPC